MKNCITDKGSNSKSHEEYDEWLEVILASKGYQHYPEDGAKTDDQNCQRAPAVLCTQITNYKIIAVIVLALKELFPLTFSFFC